MIIFTCVPIIPIWQLNKVFYLLPLFAQSEMAFLSLFHIHTRTRLLSPIIYKSQKQNDKPKKSVASHYLLQLLFSFSQCKRVNLEMWKLHFFIGCKKIVKNFPSLENFQNFRFITSSAKREKNRLLPRLFFFLSLSLTKIFSLVSSVVILIITSICMQCMSTSSQAIFIVVVCWHFSFGHVHIWCVLFSWKKICCKWTHLRIHFLWLELSTFYNRTHQLWMTWH